MTIHHSVRNSRAGFRRAVEVVAIGVTLALAACTGQPGTPVVPGSYPPNTPVGATCKAGFYRCQLPTSVPLGAPCSCPGLGAASYGRVFQR